MKLFEWLAKEGQTDMWLAEQLGISRAAVSGYRTGKTEPALGYAQKIVHLTKGAVGYDDLIKGNVSIDTIDDI